MGHSKPKKKQDRLATRNRLAIGITDRIHRDRESCNDPQIQSFLAYLRDHLFEKDFTTEKAYRECGINPRPFIFNFRKVFDKAPRSYLQHLRVMVGAELLKHTDWKLYEIADLTGFGYSQTFSDAFKEQYKERPTAYRMRLKQPVWNVKRVDTRFWEQVESLNRDEVQLLWKHISSQHSDLSERPELQYHLSEDDFYIPPVFNVTETTFQKLAIERFWLKIRGLSFAEQREQLWSEFFKTPDLFHFLKGKIIEVGRENREEGVQIARLALDAAIRTERLDENGKNKFWALAWACLGNAQRLSFRLKESEHAFQQARLFTPPDTESQIRGQILNFEASLCWYLHKLKEGIDLGTEAMKCLKEAGDTITYAKAVMTRGNIYDLKREFTLAIEDYSDAMFALAKYPESELYCAISLNIARCCWRNGDSQQALEIISDLSPKVASKDYKLLGVFVRWFEGRLELDQERSDRSIRYLEEARKGFDRMNSKLVCLVNLDLAIAFFVCNLPGKSLELLSESLPALSVWRDNPEFDYFFTRLERSARANLITLEDLKGIRDMCDSLGREPATLQRLDIRGLV